VIRGLMSDEEWACLEPFVVERGPRSGRRPKDHRLVLDGIFWIARTGVAWRDLHEHFGKWSSVYRQFRRWTLSGLFANSEHALKLITLHNSKGREFDGVALICMNNGSIPHFSTSTQEAYDEARRLFYVGLTRAKRVLIVASDQSHWKNTPTPFISEAGLG